MAWLASWLVVHAATWVLDYVMAVIGPWLAGQSHVMLYAMGYRSCDVIPWGGPVIGHMTPWFAGHVVGRGSCHG